MVLLIIVRVVVKENRGEAIFKEILAKKGTSPNIKRQSVPGQSNGYKRSRYKLPLTSPGM